MPSYVVTGAAQGIGFEFVIQLSADSGNTVFAIVRNKTTATQLKALSRNNVIVLEADITDPKALKLAAEEVAKVTGHKLDYTICSAGKSNHPGFTLDQFPSSEALEEDLLDNFKVNTIGTVHTINAFLPLLRNGSTKKVLALSTSVSNLDLTLSADIVAEPGYAISKAALNMVVAKYAAQYKAEGFVFLAICPGMVATSILPVAGSHDGEFKLMMPSIPKVAPDFKGPISPEESVKMQLEVINGWTVERSGAFVSHFGSTERWL
ncbi:hypothetical protein B0H19DRAFT_1251118 [Mycena capillaripes]|nr:hypothetical protein B0H19DRAFT_1251118 [Mycena capillaripes]